jgi:hypothetical protein
MMLDVTQKGIHPLIQGMVDGTILGLQLVQGIMDGTTLGFQLIQRRIPDLI